MGSRWRRGTIPCLLSRENKTEEETRIKKKRGNKRKARGSFETLANQTYPVQTSTPKQWTRGLIDVALSRSAAALWQVAAQALEHGIRIFLLKFISPLCFI
jgi:hypothetical protein